MNKLWYVYSLGPVTNRWTSTTWEGLKSLSSAVSSRLLIESQLPGIKTKIVEVKSTLVWSEEDGFIDHQTEE